MLAQFVFPIQDAVWLQFSAKLPNGFHQILIDAYLSKPGDPRDMLLDDVFIQNCEYFSEYE